MSKRIQPIRAAFLTLILAVPLAACARDVSNSDLVVVDGLVQRGPTGPICSVDNPCVEPISAGFTITRDGATVLHFNSGADGRFLVRLAPGDYTVVPDPEAVFGEQTKELKVPAGDSVSVTLTFDTGIY